jgi:serine/threonine-protein kinase
MLDRTQYERLLGTTLGPYHLEQLGEWNELGPVFFGREATSGTTYRIRVLAVSPTLTPEELAAYPQRFAYQAQHIATLQHPYLLPLTQYGTAGEMSYAVSPYLAARSLTVRLRQSGPLDVVTAGRYLDHIAAALEYAHERNTVHRNLTTDEILLQLDGRIVVADFGVRRMIELGERRDQRNPLRFVPGGCAPEQLMGGTVDRLTDVYGLGAVLYQLLTGHPVFSGQTPEEIAEQHLRAPVPPLGAWRSGLPGELDALLAKALAKQPQDRFTQPGALANAYARIVSPNNATRVPFTLAPQQPAGKPGVTAFAASAPLARAAQSGQVPAAALVAQAGGQATFSAGGRSRGLGWRGVGIAAALVVLIAGGMLGLRAAQSGGAGTQATGQVFFTDSRVEPTGQSDALRIVTRNLAAPPAGTTYYAWLIDSKSERVTALGALHASQDGYTVSYGGTHANLFTLGTTVEVTAERGKVSVPVGHVVLIGSFPPKAFIHIQHVLTSYPTTPEHVGLLVGTLTQDQLLTSHVQTLTHVAASGDTARVQCEAQSIVDILEGTHGAAYQPLSPACVAQNPTPGGDGFGLLGPDDDGTGGGYFSNAAEHASLAATQPDATANMHTHAARAEADLNNALRQAVTLHEDALALLKNPSDTSKVAEMSTLANEIAHGQGSGQAATDGVLGAYAQAQLMATLTLAPRA